MIGKGRDLRVYDPHIRIDSIYGSNKRFLFDTIPHIGRLVTAGLGELLSQSERVILTQAPPAADRAAIDASGLPVLDVSRIPA
jgi:GDP-mannose 6-dehydrogenase